jgi:SAM-dependent methyltransferase
VTIDPDDYRRASRERWGRSASGWKARRAQFTRAAMPVSAAMIDAIGPQPGHALLELAAGLGDTGFLAAELIEPGGTLITSDFAPEMLSAAQERAEELGLRNVRFKQIDAESIDVDTGTLDGVLCRWGYMLMVDPEAALRETRRVLKPGGRVALAAWTGAQENPWASLSGRELVRRGLAEAPDPAAPGQFAWADPARIEATLAAAGFVEDITVERVEFPIAYPSGQEWWAVQQDMSSAFRETVAGLDPAAAADLQAALRAAAAPYEQPDGSLVFPAATWVAAATA